MATEAMASSSARFSAAQTALRNFASSSPSPRRGTMAWITNLQSTLPPLVTTAWPTGTDPNSATGLLAEAGLMMASTLREETSARRSSIFMRSERRIQLCARVLSVGGIDGVGGFEHVRRGAFRNSDRDAVVVIAGRGFFLHALPSETKRLAALRPGR